LVKNIANDHFRLKNNNSFVKEKDAMIFSNQFNYQKQLSNHITKYLRKGHNIGENKRILTIIISRIIGRLKLLHLVNINKGSSLAKKNKQRNPVVGSKGA
jgi:hypothetical protein